MRLGIQYPRRYRCPRCRSGNILEIENPIELAVKKQETSLADSDLVKLSCQSCEYTWPALSS